jgi:hypothetical protein
MYICDLPDLCQALVKEALIQEVESIDDPKECLNTGARVAATLALVGNPLFTEYSDDLYDRIVDPGCLQAKRAAKRGELSAGEPTGETTHDISTDPQPIPARNRPEPIVVGGGPIE